ncbi:MAG: hypothetical protein HYW79_00880 [Parcubacteria group bacterium]|nr:hypothetical protein [Parcubacteria group bacterium]
MQHKTYNLKQSIMAVFLLFVSCFMFRVSWASAQFELPTIGSIKPAISLSSDPLTPLPNSTITIAANLSGVTGSGSSNYTWFLNGVRQTEHSGLNKSKFTFKASAIGIVYRINVNVTMPGGGVLSDAAVFTVSDVDLSWNASSEAPAGYRGKTLPTKKSAVLISALPTIYQPGTKALISSGGLVFNWFINGKLQADKSGIGRSDLNFYVGSFSGGSEEIRLEVKTGDSTVSLNKFVTVPIMRPQTFIYVADNKTSLPYGKALRDFFIESATVKAIDFVAENYFFNFPKNRLKWSWLVDSREIMGGGDKPWSAVLNVPENIARPFSFQVRAVAQNPQEDLEIAESTANLKVR